MPRRGRRSAACINAHLRPGCLRQPQQAECRRVLTAKKAQVRAAGGGGKCADFPGEIVRCPGMLADPGHRLRAGGIGIQRDYLSLCEASLLAQILKRVTVEKVL